MESRSGREWHPLEYAHVFLWLIKDMCWAMDWVTFGCMMVVPTVLSAFIITWIQRRQTAVLIHNLAISLWISANSCWMIAEMFDLEDLLKPISVLGFSVGIFLLAGFYTSRLFKPRG
ncbi:MAG TPA: hypothetical protein PKY12_00725 [Catalimonadaceae bacterium]|nr:hypothetical protein [Catalimonadaceae bacterium]